MMELLFRPPISIMLLAGLGADTGAKLRHPIALMQAMYVVEAALAPQTGETQGWRRLRLGSGFPLRTEYSWEVHRDKHLGSGANFLLADGSVRFLTYSAAPIMTALATRNGGEAVSIPDRFPFTTPAPLAEPPSR